MPNRLSKGEVLVGKLSADSVSAGLNLTTQLTTVTHEAPGTPDYAISALVEEGGAGNWGFASSDEGTTVLAVIANLQTRVAELEAQLG